MPIDAIGSSEPEPAPAWFDAGLLSPVSATHEAGLDDRSVASALVTAEAALARAWASVGVAPQEAADAISALLGWQDRGSLCELPALPLERMITGSVAGGNPVIPLVGLLREQVPEEYRAWVHRGATSQDVLDSALMLIAHRSGEAILGDAERLERALADFARAHRDEPAAARTLTQQAVPTTVGARAAGWLRGVRRASARLSTVVAELPAQIGGAGGTLASFVEIGGSAADALPAAYAEELRLAVPEAPWHTQRWPITELGDALVQTLDALGVIAADVATLSRTEIAELAEGTGGGSSAMPQKRNPAHSVLIRSAAIRAPHLAAALHGAAALAVDERPDGAWHAEWPTLRELLRLVRGSTAHAADLVSGLRVNGDAVRANLALTGGLIVAERLAIVLDPLLGAARVREIVAASGSGGELGELLRGEPALAGIDVEALLDPEGYLGMTGVLVDHAVAEARHPALPAPHRPFARPLPEEPV